MINFLFYDNQPFPPHKSADRDGLLAVGGNLTSERLIDAYSSGIFPWYNEEPVLWWSPDPRFILFPDNIRISKSMRQVLKRDIFTVKADLNFTKIMTHCSMPREKQKGTWINQHMIDAYTELHEIGIAHSIEVYNESGLCGGLYGVSLGGAFFGESMFSLEKNTSKAGLISLCHILQKNGFKLIDSQIHTSHLESLGAEFIERKNFLKLLKEALKNETITGSWSHLFSGFKTSAIFL